MELATLFGVFGVIANTLWPLVKQRRFLLAGQIVACVFMATHFVLLNAYTGAVIMCVAGIQAALAVPLESYKNFKLVYLASLFLTPLVCWYTWQGYSSIFSSLALILFCIGNLQVNTKRLRIFLISCIFAWVGHNILVASYPALISNTLALLTSLYGLSRELHLTNSSLGQIIKSAKRDWPIS